MPKPKLKAEFDTLEQELIETFLAGHKLWRPDLSYPESPFRYASRSAGAHGYV